MDIVERINCGQSNAMTDKLADHLAYPPRTLRADRAAAYLSMSKAVFLKLVSEGRLPKPKRLGGIVFWDRLKLDEFVEYFEGDDEVEAENPFERLLGNS
jgi:predicted DNA-binding transcriptional regulator AlpA